jgi:hypothetical protein
MNIDHCKKKINLAKLALVVVLDVVVDEESVVEEEAMIRLYCRYCPD